MESAWEQFFALPALQIALVFLSFAVFVIGNHLLFAAHDRRVGRRPSFLGNPFPSLSRFNAKEWQAFLIINLVTCAIFAMALHLDA